MLELCSKNKTDKNMFTFSQDDIVNAVFEFVYNLEKIIFFIFLFMLLYLKMIVTVGAVFFLLPTRQDLTQGHFIVGVGDGIGRTQAMTDVLAGQCWS